jgi:hypothetical protein
MLYIDKLAVAWTQFAYLISIGEVVVVVVGVSSSSKWAVERTSYLSI